MKYSSSLAAAAVAAVAAGAVLPRQDAPPGPTDAGISKYCSWYTVSSASDDSTCEVILKNWGITIDQFTRWNPSVGKDLAGCKLTTGHAYCVEAANEPPPQTETPTPTPTGGAPGPTQTGQPADCDRWDQVNSGDNCDTFITKYAGLTLDQFVKWNPAVGATCTKLISGTFVCTRTKGWTPPTGPAPGATPSPVQPGQVKDCDKWHFVEDGELCSAIVAQYKDLTQDELVSYNPAIKKDCSGMWAKTYLCVEVKGGKEHPDQSGTPTGPTPTDTNPTPSPVQAGQVKNCDKWHFVEEGQLCSDIVPKYKDLTQDELFSYNPAIKKDCSGMWAKTYLCVEVKGGKAHPDQSGTPPPTKPTDTNPTPSPVQPGQVKDCTRWYFAQMGDTCDTAIGKFQDLTMAEIFKFNPAVKADCSGMWANTYLCVETKTSKQHPPKGNNPPPTPTQPPGGVTTPQPIQPGMVGDCVGFTFVKPDQTCDAIVKLFKGLTVGDLVSYNPGIKKDCSGMWAKTYLCVERKNGPKHPHV